MKLMGEADQDRPPIWQALLAGLGAEYRSAKEIDGASGLQHPVEAIGVDEVGRRLIVISSETNPRVAALLRGDVQATTADFKVLVARPMAFNLAQAIRRSFFTESGSLNVPKLIEVGVAFQSQEKENEEVKALIGEPLEKLLDSANRSSLKLKNHIFSVMEQLHAIEWTVLSKLVDGGFMQIATEVLTQFSRLDPLSDDREQGICPIPTYELSEADWALFETNKDLDEIQHRLKALDIYQYFFPPADKLLLGLVERGTGSLDSLGDGFLLSDEQGHVVSENALIDNAQHVSDIIAELRAKGYMVEGEMEFELTELGHSTRKVVRFRPSEGLIAKISKILSLKVDINLQDLLRKQ